MKYLKYLIEIKMHNTEVMNHTGNHFVIKLFTFIAMGASYIPVDFANKVTFFVRIFDKLEFEWAIMLWKASKEPKEVRMKMYDA
tara:strand:+ start:815 stop:1066 length:252 start_codon:yes stop_codon:yes gene_type:complete